MKNFTLLLAALAPLLTSPTSWAKSFPENTTILVKGKSLPALERLYVSETRQGRRRGLLGLALDLTLGHPTYNVMDEVRGADDGAPGPGCMAALKNWVGAFANRYPQAFQGKKILLTVYDDHQGLCDRNDSDNMSCGAYVRRNLPSTFAREVKFAALINSEGGCVTPDWTKAASNLGKYNSLVSELIPTTQQIESVMAASCATCAKTGQAGLENKNLQGSSSSFGSGSAPDSGAFSGL